MLWIGCIGCIGHILVVSGSLDSAIKIFILFVLDAENWFSPLSEYHMSGNAYHRLNSDTSTILIRNPIYSERNIHPNSLPLTWTNFKVPDFKFGWVLTVEGNARPMYEGKFRYVAQVKLWLIHNGPGKTHTSLANLTFAVRVTLLLSPRTVPVFARALEYVHFQPSWGQVVGNIGQNPLKRMSYGSCGSVKIWQRTSRHKLQRRDDIKKSAFPTSSNGDQIAITFDRHITFRPNLVWTSVVGPISSLDIMWIVVRSAQAINLKWPGT